MVTFIYILICPIDDQIKYVGKSNNPDKRLKDHLLDFRCMDLHKATWIKKLRQQKLKPILVVIDEVTWDDWKYWEHWWCQYFKSLGFTLFNSRSRNGLTYANSKTFKPGNIPWNKKQDLNFDEGEKFIPSQDIVTGNENVDNLPF